MTDQPAIAKEPVELVDVTHKDARWEKPVFTGFMTKQGQVNKNWKKRFFILTNDGRLWYFKNEKQKKPLKKEPVYIQSMKFWGTCDRKPNCIKVERYPNSFYFFGATERDKLKWISKLREVGCLYCEQMKPTEDIKKYEFQNSFPKIFKTDLKAWSVEDTQHWVELIFHSGVLEDKSIQQNEVLQAYLKKLSGKQLEKLSLNELKKKGGCGDPKQQEYILSAQRELKINRLFPYGIYCVAEKILNHVGRVMDKVSLRNFSVVLSDPELLIETYLNPRVSMSDFQVMEFYLKRNEDYFEDFEEAANEEELEGEGEGGDEETKNKKKELSEKQKLDRMNKMILDGLTIDKKPALNREDSVEFSVKFVVTDLIRNDWDSAAYMLTPVLENHPPVKKGARTFHSALVVGPWLLDFEDNHSLIIPRKLDSGLAGFFNSFEEIGKIQGKTFAQVTDTLAELICSWNTTNVNFKPVPSLAKILSKKSCQEFVEEVLKAFGIEHLFEGIYGDFVEKIKNRGSLDLVFMPSKEFEDAFKLEELKEKKEEDLGGQVEGGDDGGEGGMDPMEGIAEDMGFDLGVENKEDDGKGIEFETHKDLDDFLNRLKTTNEQEWTSETSFTAEKKLLAILDRAFWLKHLFEQENEKYKPSEDGCLFGLPKGNFTSFE